MAPQLVWINGPFGGGKTQTAHELHRRITGSLVSDPELLGFGMHRMLPPKLRGDFQNFRTWRTGVREVLEQLLHAHAGTDRLILVPMTVVRADYLEEMLDPLDAAGHEVRHFSLLASPETVRRRLRNRAIPFIKADTWALERVDECLEALRAERFAEQLDTDALTVPEVAGTIAARIGRVPLPAKGRLRGAVDRFSVGVRHIRIG